MPTLPPFADACQFPPIHKEPMALLRNERRHRLRTFLLWLDKLCRRKRGDGVRDFIRIKPIISKRERLQYPSVGSLRPPQQTSSNFAHVLPWPIISVSAFIPRSVARRAETRRSAMASYGVVRPTGGGSTADGIVRLTFGPVAAFGVVRGRWQRLASYFMFLHVRLPRREQVRAPHPKNVGS